MLLVLGLLVGCASPRGTRGLGAGATREPVGPRIDVEYQPRDAEAARQVRLAVERALPRLQRWGTFDDTVTIVVHPNHASLERAANRPGHDFLRAWARYEQIELQSPRTWSSRGASQGQVDELLLHELTHSLMYQVASDRLGWTRKRIPLWFREGMASYTAEQGYRVSSLDDLEQYWRKHPHADPLSQADALYQAESGVVYGAAHHAFTFLVRRYGEDAIRGVLDAMGRGPDFDRAFQQAVGVPQERFLQDFRRYVRLRGFKGARQLHPLRPRPAMPLPVAPLPTLQ
ncbi:hypothetical protein LILAB_21155 [Corallococcus macrosporus]|uniref:Uncharacterized protein n=1 Tax=Myxococcus fulvus (strain ATCC BAA-855 / HW-1) TaxID=483219 RepID=F8CFW2_MYXFH|nr:hypothetical protein [Corallococcus macrosporus]AEI66131.1 hypothetical protein LILAB_21155 [Corallococcus macrosporus]